MASIDWIRKRSGPHWIGFYVAILMGWGALFFLEAGRHDEFAGLTGADYLLAICGIGPGGANLAGLTVMWAVMSLAMMAPTILPSLVTYDDLRRTGAANRLGFVAVIAGYSAVWFGFAVVAASAQVGLSRLGALDALGRSQSFALTAVILMFAGVYQFSALKGACVRQCRNPMTFFMENWAPGVVHAFRMGLHLGVLCLGCCWALMALAFAAGTMNLLWMGAAMVLMTLEKLPEIGEALTRPLGYGLLAGGLAFAGLTLAGIN